MEENRGMENAKEREWNGIEEKMDGIGLHRMEFHFPFQFKIGRKTYIHNLLVVVLGLHCGAKSLHGVVDAHLEQLAHLVVQLGLVDQAERVHRALGRPTRARLRGRRSASGAANLNIFRIKI